jgi:hypothetical protein
VVNVYAARVVENRNPCSTIPCSALFRQGIPREQVQRSPARA